MADHGPFFEEFQPPSHHHHHTSTKSILGASMAGITIGGPLLGMMAFSFLASMTRLLITSPLLLIFSPLLLGAAVVLAGALAGFGASLAMAFVGLSSLLWIWNELRRRRRRLVGEGGGDGGGGGGVVDWMADAGDRVKEWGGSYFPEDKVQGDPNAYDKDEI